MAPDPEPHFHGGPRPLYGVAHHEDDLRVGHQSVDVGYSLLFQDRVVGRRLARDPAPALLEERGVPPVVRPPEEVPEIPGEVLAGALLRCLPQPGPELPAPAFVYRSLPDQPGEDPAMLLDLLVEVMELLLPRHPDPGVRLEVAVQPRRARFLSPYSDEVRERHEPVTGAFTSQPGWRPEVRSAPASNRGP